MAFALLRTVVTAWYAGVEASAANRLITRHAVSFVFPLPLSYRDRIAQVPGVEKVTYATWFSGVYIDKNQFFARLAVDSETFLMSIQSFSSTKTSSRSLGVSATPPLSVLTSRRDKQYVPAVVLLLGSVHAEGLIEAFQSGEDLHAFIASRSSGSVRARSARSSGPDQGDELRPGLRAVRLRPVRTAQITPEEARGLIHAYFERFGGVRDFLGAVVESSRLHRLHRDHPRPAPLPAGPDQRQPPAP